MSAREASQPAPAALKVLMAPRGGRDRKPGERYPSGQIRPAREEPSGVQLRRVVISEISGAERDMRLSYPLGVIRARMLVTEVEHLAGLEFVRRWVASERPKFPPSCLGNADRVSGGGNDEGPSARAEHQYGAARDVLLETGSKTFRTVREIVCYEHWPRFLDTERRRSLDGWKADERDVAALRLGLQVLSKEFGLSDRSTGDVAELRDSVASHGLRRAARISAAKPKPAKVRKKAKRA